MAGGGYDIGASLAQSASSGASNSGATDIKGGGNFGGTAYGPGSLVKLDQSGSLGASAAAGGSSLTTWILIAIAGLAAVFVIPKIFNG
jgi:hypothetical protein